MEESYKYVINNRPDLALVHRSVFLKYCCVYLHVLPCAPLLYVPPSSSTQQCPGDVTSLPPVTYQYTTAVASYIQQYLKNGPPLTLSCCILPEYRVLRFLPCTSFCSYIPPATKITAAVRCRNCCGYQGNGIGRCCVRAPCFGKPGAGSIHPPQIGPALPPDSVVGGRYRRRMNHAYISLEN